MPRPRRVPPLQGSDGRAASSRVLREARAADCRQRSTSANSSSGLSMTTSRAPPIPREDIFALSPSQRRGLRLVHLNCARCHAIDKVGESPLAHAPAFRTLHLKYPVSDLQRPLAQGVYPEMPWFQLEAGQVEDIMAYLKTQ
jgi:cytochrome c